MDQPCGQLCRPRRRGSWCRGRALLAEWAPNPFSFYVEYMGRFHRHYPDLHCPFANGIFSACTFNLGPRTCALGHRDFVNFALGWCPIIAFGDFDYKKGGHLILWDCKLIIEFPPGCTILIPSAAVFHSKIPIAPHEHRYSFTQYTASGLFRWVERGFKSEEDYFVSLSAEGRQEEKILGRQRAAAAADMFSTIAELRAMDSFHRFHRVPSHKIVLNFHRFHGILTQTLGLEVEAISSRDEKWTTLALICSRRLLFLTTTTTQLWRLPKIMAQDDRLETAENSSLMHITPSRTKLGRRKVLAQYRNKLVPEHFWHISPTYSFRNREELAEKSRIQMAHHRARLRQDPAALLKYQDRAREASTNYEAKIPLMEAEATAR
ncbi:hypothetical protein C8R47DRAFT_1197494 [Mycena vitilis]|nr:hypothetical protein C8R47DRAFT_1197494 [Mycena vitilis]